MKPPFVINKYGKIQKSPLNVCDLLKDLIDSMVKEIQEMEDAKMFASIR